MTVNLTLAKQHLKLETADEDALVAVYLSAATAWVEGYTGKLLTRRYVTQEEPGFATYLALSWGPSPADLSLAYTDSDGAEQTLSDARLVGLRAYAPLAGWPTSDDYAPVVLTYTAGFETAPADLDAAILLLTGEYHRNREAGSAAPSTIAAVEALCRPHRDVLI